MLSCESINHSFLYDEILEWLCSLEIIAGFLGYKDDILRRETLKYHTIFGLASWQTDFFRRVY